MSFVLSSISGNLISAASAGYAPTNSGDVSAIASAYQVVTATATQLYAGTAYLTSVNGAPVSASRAGQAANASLATSAYYDGTGRLISALPDSAAVSAIASAYAESAASSKQDTLAFAYNTADQISSINGSALGGMDEAAVSSIASAYAENAASSKLDASASSDFYSTANPSGFLTGVDLSPYQTTADMSGYIPTSMSSDFQQVTGMSSYVPYSSIGYNTASAISGINGSALAGTTYSAGTGIDITDDVISVEAPVDIVAGPGIVIDNPDGNTLRVSQAANYETLLWSGTAPSARGDSITLSGNIKNFDRIALYWNNVNGSQCMTVDYLNTESTYDSYYVDLCHAAGYGNSWIQWLSLQFNTTAQTILFDRARNFNFGSQNSTTWTNPTVTTSLGDAFNLCKVVGIHRTASN